MRRSTILYLTIFITFILYKKLKANPPEYINDEKIYYHPLELLRIHRDKMIYLKSVEYMADYSLANLNEVNINLAFGLYAARHHLTLIYDYTGYKIPKSLTARIDKILDTLSNVIKRYRFRIDTLTGSDEEMFKQFTDNKCWKQRIKHFYNYTHHPYLKSELEDIYSPWKTYQDNIAKFHHWIPSPRQSENCLRSLAKNPISYKTFWTLFSNSQCSISPVCKVFLNSGTTFGYALYHRLLLLILARYGRGCIITHSTSEDDRLMEQFCSMGYAEIEYIVNNNYGNPDIMLEIMFLCTLNGQSEFLNRTWLQALLKFQIKKGCFGSKAKVVGQENTTRLNCNSHTTGVAVGTYAAAVRYLCRKYFHKDIP